MAPRSRYLVPIRLAIETDHVVTTNLTLRPAMSISIVQSYLYIYLDRPAMCHTTHYSFLPASRLDMS